MEKSSAHLSSPLKSLLSEINEEKSVKLTLKARDALMLVLLLSAPDVTRAKVKLPEHFEFSDRLVRLLRKALSIDSPHYPDLIFEAMADTFVYDSEGAPVQSGCSGYSQLPEEHKRALVATDIKLKYALQAIADIKSLQTGVILEALGKQIEESSPIDPDEVFDEYIKHLDSKVKEGR